MGQSKVQRHTVQWYSEGQLVWVCKVADGACVQPYYPTSSERSFCCWEKQGEEGKAFDFRTPVCSDLSLFAVYSEQQTSMEGCFAVGAGAGSLLVSHWQEHESLRMQQTDADTYRIALVLYRGDTLQFKQAGTWRGQMGIAGLVPDGERESFCFFGTAEHGDIIVQQSGEYVFEWHRGEQPCVKVKRVGDAPEGLCYPDWYIVGDMNAWHAEQAYLLTADGDVYTAILEIDPKVFGATQAQCHFMLHNPITGQYRGAPDGGHLSVPCGTYRITARLPLGNLSIEPIDPEQEE